MSSYLEIKTELEKNKKNNPSPNAGSGTGKSYEDIKNSFQTKFIRQQPSGFIVRDKQEKPKGALQILAESKPQDWIQKSDEGLRAYIQDKRQATAGAQQQEKLRSMAFDPLMEANPVYFGMVKDYANDTSYKEIGDDWTEEQRRDFGYYYAQDKDRALEYAIQVNDLLKTQAKQIQKEAAAGKATDNLLSGAWETAKAIGAGTLGIGEYIMDAAEMAGRGRITEKSDRISPTEYYEAVTGSIGEKLNEDYGTINENVPILGGRGLGDLYGIGTSVARSMATGHLLGGIGKAAGLTAEGIGAFTKAGTLMSYFGSAAAAGIDEVRARGGTDSQALALGTLEGMAEAFAEMAGMDNLFKLGTASTFRGFATNMMKQGAAEGMEEALTSILNTISDEVIMGELGNRRLLIDHYVQNGWTEEEAARQAFVDTIEDIAFDAISGFASGTVSGGLETVIQNTAIHRDYRNTYGQSAAQLVDEGLIAPKDSLSHKLAQQYKQTLDAGKQLSGAQIHRLVRAQEQQIMAEDADMIRGEVVQMLQRLGEPENITGIADIITKEVTGQKLTRAQQRTLENSSFGTWVLDALNPDSAMTQYVRQRSAQTGEDSGQWYTEAAETIDAAMLDYSFRKENLSADELNRYRGWEMIQANRERPQRQEQPDYESAEEPENIQPVAEEETEAPVQTTDDIPQAVQERVETAQEAPAESITLEDLSGKYGKQAAAMRHTYKAGQDVEAYDRAFQRAFDMGKSGVPYEYVRNSESTAYLTESQKQIAYETGMAASGMDAAQLRGDNAARANGKTGHRRGSVRGQGVTVEDLSKSFNRAQKNAYKFLTTIADVTGLDIVLYDSEADADGNFRDEQGYFRWNEDTVYIDINAGLKTVKDIGFMENYTMMRTFTHEFTHFIEKHNAGEYNGLRSIVFETMTANGVNVDEMISLEMARSDGKMDYDQASREVVAQALTDILPQSGFMEELARKNESLFRQLLDRLKAFLSDLKAHFSGMKAGTREAAALKQQIGETVAYVEQIVKKFDEVAVKAVHSYQSTVAEDVAVSKEENTSETATEESVIETAEVASKDASLDASPASAAEEKLVQEPETKAADTEETSYRSDNGYTIRRNPEYGSLEVSFDGKPPQPVRDALKANKFRWNGKRRVWYGKTDQKTIVDALDKAYQPETAPEQSDFEKAFWNASQEERDEVVEAISQNTKLTHMMPTEIQEPIAPVNTAAEAEKNIKEATNNGKESENGPDAGAVRQSERSGEGTPRLLEGVEPEPVQRGSEGRGSVRAGVDEGTADAERNGPSDAAGTVQVRSTGDRVGGDLQQLSELTEQTGESRSEETEAEQLHQEVRQEIQEKSTVTPRGENLVIGDSLDLPKGTKARVRANIEAIRIVKQLIAEGRFATAAEQEALSKYVGWGGLADAFGEPVSNRETRKVEYKAKSGLEEEFDQLKQLLSEDEYKAARESTRNAHYTSVEVIKAMYDGLKHLGFTGGRMLEPSSGVGNFVGAMPAEMTATVKSWTMVEIDSITGLIAKYLYPNSDVRIQGFQDTNIPDNYMDVAIGNVPFGNYGIKDKHYPNTVTESIHNYFFAKALDKVRPGGLVMFITSRYTMDSRESAFRKYIMQRADLLGAVRLPNTAFSSNAGTSVVTDILILKKRPEKTAYSGEGFTNVSWQNFGRDGAAVNEYFASHPQMVLGETSVGRGMYGNNELTVNPYTDRGSLGEQIRAAMESIQGKMDYTGTESPETANRKQAAARKKAQRLTVKDGVIHTSDGQGHLQKLEVDSNTAKRIAGMVGIRDVYAELCDALQQGAEKKTVNALRRKLNKLYDGFVETYGYLNAPKNKAAINSFADRYSILSLENYTPKEGKKEAQATKTDIFFRDTISPNKTAAKAENVEEGLTISMNTLGYVDASMIARLTGEPVQSVTRQLIDQRLVFKDKDGVLIPAAQYLSGNVRAKLRQMEGLVSIDADYRNNVEALKAVVPPTVEYTDIYVNPGATWVPVSVYQDFVSYILDRGNHKNWRTGKMDFQVDYVQETNEYKVSINDAFAKSGARNTQMWGESGKTFAVIFENMLNGRRTNVYMDGPDGKRVIDKVKTEAVAQKAEKLGEEFRKWLWEDDSRRGEMQELYNEVYNSLVTPKYSGENLSINGLNATFSLRPHQSAAVSRIINSGGNTLLAHRVGAGKTMEMAAAAMKLKQLGVIRKPMFVVPNNVVAQWGKEFKDYFPAANILLVGDEDMTPAERMTTINRIKNNDYDAVILAYTKFEKIQMTKAWRQKFYEEQIESIMFAINAEKENNSGKGFTVKQLEVKRKQLEGKLDKLTTKEKDEDGAMFEDLGVDSLFVDEAHNFKNLEYATRMNNVSGLGDAEGSQRAFDLYTKVRYLQQLNGGRGIVFATATPVMNSMTEMYIMQRYLQPDTLKQLGVDNFDAWAKMFGEVVNTLEIAPSGSGYRVKQSFSRFKNVKALQQLFRSFTDVLTEVPGLKIPKMKGGKVQIVECEPGEFQTNYMEELAKRAENVKNVDPSVDNMLKITSDGRKISYSQRMIDPSLPYEEAGKIYKCCENVWRVYRESRDTRGTQMIFCDMATPKGKSSSRGTEGKTDEFGTTDQESARIYEDIRDRLIQLGIPAKEIAFIHDAKNDKQKAKLSEKMNDGTIRVLLGSTAKMGVGLNAQQKAVAIHHLDAPWRPGDIEQRDGRVFRQKNENSEAYKFVYVTRGSFDSRLWDILDRKQKFINQVMNGDDVGNEIEDTGEVTLSAAEVKAIASGNPMIEEQIGLEKEIDKLESLQQAHIAGVNRARELIVRDQQRIAMLEKRVEDVKTDISQRKDTYSSEKVFSIQLGGRTYTDKKSAGLALITEAQASAKEGAYTAIGKFAGFTLRVVKTKEGIEGVVAGAGNYGFKTYPLNPTYGITHLTDVVEGLDTNLENWQNSLKETKKDLVIQESLAAEPFRQAGDLRAKRARYREIMDILNPPVEQRMEEDKVQYQRRDETLSDREVLAIAADAVSADNMTEAEIGALEIFRKRLNELEKLQTERVELGRQYRQLQFGKNVNREEAAKVLTRMKLLDEQIEAAGKKVLDVEEKKVLQDVLKKARKVVEQQQKAHDDEILKRWRDRRNNAAAIRKYQRQITENVTEMAEWVRNPGNKDILKHIPDALKNSVIPFLTSIDFTSKRQLRGGNATKADKKFAEQMKTLRKALKDNISETGLYSGYNDLPPDFMEKLDAAIETVEALTGSAGESLVINRMTADELKNLSGIVANLKKLVKDFNRFHYNSMFAHVHEAGDDTIRDLQEYSPDRSRLKVFDTLNNFVFWQQMRPAYVWERFGKGGTAIYDGLRRGQAQLAFDTKTILDFSEKTYNSDEVHSWEKDISTVTLDDGSEIRITPAQAMSFYLLSKDKDSLRHILGGGVRVATYRVKGEKISDDGHLMTQNDVEDVIGTLTERQKEVADKLQAFMAQQGGEWGNYVSVKRFGEKMFENPTYFPINSDGRHLKAEADEMPEGASLYALLNKSFTKTRNEFASNRIVLYSVFDVFANHMASMAQYHSMALPILDALKWFNYQQKEDGKVVASVRDELNRVYGGEEESRPGAKGPGYAEKFIINILKAYNGTEAQGISTDAGGLSMRHRYNLAQVAFNTRVAIQQPLAITRAGMIVPYKSVIEGMKLKPEAIERNIREMLQYSGIAAWKDLGFYDINISRGVTDLIKHKQTVMDKVAETGMWGAEKMDQLTWAGIWSACKEEMLNRGMKMGSEGFYEAVAELFEEVIYKTQVVDSIMTKNEYMRSKGLYARTMASFMSEPVTSASMVLDTADKYYRDLRRGMSHAQAWKKHKGNIARTFYVYSLGAALLAAVQAVVDGLRDDEEYKTYDEKWTEAFWDNLVNELNPLNKLPIFSEVNEIIKELLAAGWQVDVFGQVSNLTYVDILERFVKGVEILSDKINNEATNYTLYGGIYKLLQGVSGLTGLPMAAATREIVTAWNNIVGRMAPSYKVKTYDAGDMADIRYAYTDGYLTEEEATAELLNKGLVEDADEAYWKILEWESGDDSFSRYDRLYETALSGGDIGDAVQELTDHGYTEKEVYSQLKSQIGKWYYDEESEIRITKQEAVTMLRKYTDLDSDEITETVNKWSCRVVTGIAYDDIRQAFLDGDITAGRAAEMYRLYGGYSREEAKQKVDEWVFEEKYGFSYGARKTAYLEGKVSADKLKKAMMNYGGMTEQEALEQIAVYDWEREVPGGTVPSISAMEGYREYCEPAGISKRTYSDFYAFYLESGEEGVNYSKVRDCVGYIDSLPVSSAQKDALALSIWAASTVRRYKTW